MNAAEDMDLSLLAFVVLQLRLHCAYVQSILESVIIAWGGTYKTNLRLLITQKAIIKGVLKESLRHQSNTIFDKVRGHPD